MNDERIVAWLDGELSSDEAAQLEAEITAKPVLQAEVERMRSIKTALQSLPRERAPRNFTLDVNEYGRAPRERFSIFSKWAMSAAALAAVVLVAAVLFNQFPLSLPLSSSSGDMAEEDSVGAVANSSSDEPSGAAVDDASERLDALSDESAEVIAYSSSEPASESEPVLESAEDADENDADADMDAEEEETDAVVIQDEEDDQLEPMVPMMGGESASSTILEQLPEPRRAPLPYDFTLTDTFSGAMATADGTIPTTASDSGSSWVDALRDLAIGFLILLLVICIFVFGLGMWILLSRHQR